MTKVIWRMGEKATGRYKSFQRRQWPHASFHKVDGDPAARIVPVDKDEDYRPAIKEACVLRVLVADYRVQGETFRWRFLKGEVVGITQAKALFAKFLADNPNWKIPDDH